MNTAERAIDADLETLASAKQAWPALSLPIKIAMLRTLKRGVHRAAPGWVAAACAAKGLEAGSQLAGEEWLSGPWAVLYAINRYIRTLEAIDATGTRPPLRARNKAGRTVLEVFPHDMYDRALLTGVRAEVWMQREPQAYEAPQQGRVALVLGAGNIASIAPLDVLYKLIAGGAVCMLKMNPVNAYLQPFFEQAFEAFVQAGFLRFASGGSERGAYLCAHPLVDEIHITGSERTHAAILREAPGKSITSELGNVTPVIVLPGKWSRSDIRYQAEHIATQKAHNAGFNCIAAQVLILPRDWEHTAALKNEIARVFSQMEQRPEYYPGAAQRREDLAGASASTRAIVDVDAKAPVTPLLQDEAFCGVLASVELPGSGEEYLAEAVRFANNLPGTLGATLIAKGADMKAHRDAFERALADLRYGTVGVNAWTGVGYFLTETPWGAYPGHTPELPGSGLGVVHNAYLLQDTEKSIVYAPFRSFPKPPWFITNRAAAHIGQALCDFEMRRSLATLARVAGWALRA